MKKPRMGKAILFGIMVVILSSFVKGDVAPDFTLKDINGQDVTLSSFKGKVVYMDIWATWCGPCMAEVKHARRLREHYKDNPDMVFMYVSIDENEQAWRDVVKKKEIGGVNLWSKQGKDQDIIKKFNANTIPRFILINKKGEMVDADAPWPNDHYTIIDRLDSLLAE